MTWLTVTEYLCHRWPAICSVCRNPYPVLLPVYDYHRMWLLTWAARRVPHVEQEVLTLPEHLTSPPVFSGVRVAQSLVFYVVLLPLFVLSFLFWPRCCLFFDLWFLITPSYLQSFLLKADSTWAIQSPWSLSLFLFIRKGKNTFAGGGGSTIIVLHAWLLIWSSIGRNSP